MHLSSSEPASMSTGSSPANPSPPRSKSSTLTPASQPPDQEILMNTDRGWTWPQASLAVLLGAGSIAITVPPFIEIYQTVTQVVRPWFGAWAWVVPVCGEISWCVIFGAGVLMAMRRVAGGPLRSGLQAALIAGSIALNVYAARNNAADVIAHVVVVASFFGTLAVTKSTIPRLALDRIKSDTLTIAEWLIPPAQSFRLWREMTAWGETSAAAARARYTALLYAVALAQSDPRVGRAPFAWRRRLPVTLRYQLAAGVFAPDVEASITGPAAVPGGWQEPVREHVSKELRLLDRTPFPSGPTDSAEKPSETPAGKPSGQPAEKPLRKPSQATVRKMSAADLAPYVERLLGTDPQPSKQKVMDFFHVGADKA